MNVFYSLVSFYVSLSILSLSSQPLPPSSPFSSSSCLSPSLHLYILIYLGTHTRHTHKIHFVKCADVCTLSPPLHNQERVPTMLPWTASLPTLPKTTPSLP